MEPVEVGGTRTLSRGYSVERCPKTLWFDWVIHIGNHHLGTGCIVRFGGSLQRGGGVNHLGLDFHSVTSGLPCLRGLCTCLSSLTCGRGHSVVAEGLLGGAGGFLGPRMQP